VHASPPSADGIAGADAQRFILLVSGAPASGKSSLARAVAQALPFALISKDALKETLYDSLSAELSHLEPAALSSRLSHAAMELLWAVAAGCPRVILEANFRPHSEYERSRIAALPGRKLELYCHCAPQEAQRRFAARAARRKRHPAHSVHTMSAAMVAEYDQPVGLCPVIPIDTTGRVETSEVLAQIRRAWPEISLLRTAPLR
jgi:predicted kinase